MYSVRFITNKHKRGRQKHTAVEPNITLASEALSNYTNFKYKLIRLSNKRYAKYQDLQSNYPGEYKKHHKSKLEFHKNLIDVANASIKAAEEELEELKSAIPTREQFYELTHLYLETLENKHDLLERNAILSEVVSNLRAGDDAVSVITLNKPYDLLVD